MVALPRLSRRHHHTGDNIQSVLQRLREAGLKLKLSKCSFFKERVNYLGHIISREGIAPDLSRANIAKPLHRLTENASKFVWTTDCQQAFGKLRLLLSQAPVLAHPNFKNSFTLDTDASDNGIGAVLSQIGEDGEEHVIAYGSRLLTKPERNYCVTRKELLAVVYFVDQYRPYLLGQEFTLRTDHGCLTWLRNFKDPEGQLARWLEKLQEFDFTIVHRRRRSHSNADALSRLPCSQCGRATHEQPCHTANILTTDVRPPAVQTDDLRAVQLADPLLGSLLFGKESGHKPTPLDMGGASRYTRRLIQIWDQLQVCNGVLPGPL